MTDTVIGGSSGDAVKYPHDEGLPSISDGSETWGSAGYLMALGQAVDGGSYVRSDSELSFTGHDGTNDEVDVTAGIAYLDLSGETVNVQSTLGGSSPPAYDTALPTLPSIMVVVPTTVTNLSATDSTLNDFWLAYATDGTVTGVSAGDVWIRHGSGLSAPPHPNVKLGQANPDSASADVLENRGGSPTFEAVIAGNADVTGETYIEASRGSASLGIGSGTWTNIVDTEDVDNLNEFNASLQFEPSETATYTVIASAAISPGADGDLIRIRLRNTTDGSNVVTRAFEVGGAQNTNSVMFTWSGELTSGKVYEAQGNDNDSTYTLSTTYSYLQIIDGVVHA